MARVINLLLFTGGRGSDNRDINSRLLGSASARQLGLDFSCWSGLFSFSAHQLDAFSGFPPDRHHLPGKLTSTHSPDS